MQLDKYFNGSNLDRWELRVCWSRVFPISNIKILIWRKKYLFLKNIIFRQIWRNILDENWGFVGLSPKANLIVISIWQKIYLCKKKYFPSNLVDENWQYCWIFPIFQFDEKKNNFFKPKNFYSILLLLQAQNPNRIKEN